MLPAGATSAEVQKALKDKTKVTLQTNYVDDL